MTYRQEHDGEPVLPIMDGYKMKCCDCGLVHTINFRAIKIGKRFEDGSFTYKELDSEKYGVEITAWRNNRATAAGRRKK